MQHKQVKEIYKKPIIKVVSFKVENGFGDSSNRSAVIPTNSQNVNLTSDGLSSESLGNGGTYSTNDISYF